MICRGKEFQWASIMGQILQIGKQVKRLTCIVERAADQSLKGLTCPVLESVLWKTSLGVGLGPVFYVSIEVDDVTAA